MIGEVAATGLRSPGRMFGLDAQGNVLAVVTEGGLSMYEVATGRRTHHLVITPRAYAVAFDPRGGGLAFATDTGAALWQFARDGAVELPTRTPVIALAYTPTGDLATLTMNAGVPQSELAYWPAGATAPRWHLVDHAYQLAFAGGEIRTMGINESTGWALADGASHAIAPGTTVQAWSPDGSVDVRSDDEGDAARRQAGEHVLWRTPHSWDDSVAAAFAPRSRARRDPRRPRHGVGVGRRDRAADLRVGRAAAGARRRVEPARRPDSRPRRAKP